MTHLLAPQEIPAGDLLSARRGLPKPLLSFRPTLPKRIAVDSLAPINLEN
jgi:hypothetical protein